MAVHYYLSLGDSLAAGQQPIGDPEDMYRTADGYTDQLYEMARSHDPGLRHVKLGCPGETTATMLDGGICSYEDGSQLETALEFLHAHATITSFITIDIGWNDIDPAAACILGGLGTPAECMAPGIASIQAHLPGILAAIKAVAPDVPIVGMSIYDPYLASWLQGTPEGRALAALSVDLIAGTAAQPGLNDLIRGIYAAAGIPVADVESAFFTTDFLDQVPLEEFGSVPMSVATICAYTWMCAPAPLGPDNHANHDGYRAIALAFASHLW